MGKKMTCKVQRYFMTFFVNLWFIGSFNCRIVLKYRQIKRRGNLELTIQRHRHYWAEEREQRRTKKNRIQKTKNMSNTYPTKKLEVNPGAREG